MIDPGPTTRAIGPPCWPPRQARGTLRWILVTHTHVDHAPGAAALAQATGAQVVGFGPAEGFAPDLCVRRRLDAARSVRGASRRAAI